MVDIRPRLTKGGNYNVLHRETKRVVLQPEPQCPTHIPTCVVVREKV